MQTKCKAGVIRFVAGVGGVAGLLNTRPIMEWVVETGHLISLETCISICVAWLFSICLPLPSMWEPAVEELGSESFQEEVTWSGINKYAKQGFQQQVRKRKVERKSEGGYVYPLVFRYCLNSWCAFILRVGSIAKTWPLSWIIGFSTQQFLSVTTCL